MMGKRITLLILVTLTLSATVMAKRSTKEVDPSSARAEFFFVLDQSLSVGIHGIRDEIQFVLRFLHRPSNLNVGTNRSALAVATFNNKLHEQISFQEAHKKSEAQITEKLKRLRGSLKNTGSKKLDVAINSSIELMHDRAMESPDLPRYIILVTDVNEIDSKPMKRQPVEGIRFLCVIINEHPYEAELDLCHRTYVGEKFEDLRDVITRVNAYLAKDLCLSDCSNGKCEPFTDGCRCNEGFEKVNNRCMRKPCDPVTCPCPCIPINETSSSVCPCSAQWTHPRPSCCDKKNLEDMLVTGLSSRAYHTKKHQHAKKHQIRQAEDVLEENAGKASARKAVESVLLDEDDGETGFIGPVDLPSSVTRQDEEEPSWVQDLKFNQDAILMKLDGMEDMLIQLVNVGEEEQKKSDETRKKNNQQ